MMSADCLQELKNGDQHAFKLIYDQYASPLFAFTMKHVKSKSLAQEIVHDVFMKLWQSKEKIRLDTSFKAFLFTICRNHILNTLRKASKEVSIENEIIASHTSLHVNPQADLDFKELQNNANQAITNLPPQRQLVFKLNKDDGKSYDEIALHLGISKGTVKDHIFKARKFIKSYLKKRDPYLYLEK